jgi:8-oxo-dGTP pyrophosphatase MutT (NUDIX family)
VRSLRNSTLSHHNLGNSVLLTQREDFEVWCLPGGDTDARESVAQAAIREAYEETGLEVELTHLVGIYSLPEWRVGGNHNVLFAARPVGGVLQPAEEEVLDVGYFDPHDLPNPLIWWHRQRILDALNGAGRSVVWSQNVVWPFEQEVARQELYYLRDQSGLSRQEFYLQYFKQLDSNIEKLEVNGVS